jgi:hypothetical protein
MVVLLVLAVAAFADDPGAHAVTHPFGRTAVAGTISTVAGGVGGPARARW